MRETEASLGRIPVRENLSYARIESSLGEEESHNGAVWCREVVGVEREGLVERNVNLKTA